MSTSKNSEDSEIGSVRDLLSAELARRLSALNVPLAKGEVPSEDDTNAIERLSKLITLLPLQKIRRSQQIDLVLLFAAVPVLLASAFIRLPTAAVDIEVRATGMTLTLGGNHSDLLIPGESGEILALSQARISGADEVSPPSMGQGSTVEIRQLVLDKLPPTIRKTDLAVRLQEIAVPFDIPFKLGVSLAYAAQSRGLMLHATGEKPARAQFGEVIPIGSDQNNNAQTRFAIRPVRVSGKDLEMELIPFNNAAPLTILRDVHISQISFGDDGRSSILGGSAVVKSRSENKISVQASDNLDIQSATPMLVRELKFAKGELEVTLTTPSANVMSLGDDPPRDLRPTLFEWIRFRWPTQLYGALSALAALWFAARTWWKSPE